MPLFLQSIGFSSVLIGILEGVAEATAGLSKGYFGRLSDSTGKRLRFVQWGYWLSAISKPMMAALTYPLWIFSARAIDRLGKGVRTGARDAILSDETSAETKGRVFGFHRSMDTLGAAIGPVASLTYLSFYPGQYKTMFLLAFIPAAVAGFLTLLVQEKPQKIVTDNKPSFRLSQAFNYLPEAPKTYRHLIFILLLFSLFNSSDLFLLMRIKQAGWGDDYVIGSYILYNLVYALAAFPLGKLADSIGFKKTLLLGLITFSLVYAGFGWNSSLYGFILLFVLYGIYAAATEGISKAFISNIVNKNETASALGTYTGLNSLSALLASSIAGFLWHYTSPETVFFFSAAGSLLAAFLLWRVKYA
jgi:MFS family permease